MVKKHEGVKETKENEKDALPIFRSRRSEKRSASVQIGRQDSVLLSFVRQSESIFITNNYCHIGDSICSLSQPSKLN